MTSCGSHDVLEAPDIFVQTPADIVNPGYKPCQMDAIHCPPGKECVDNQCVDLPAPDVPDVAAPGEVVGDTIEPTDEGGPTDPGIEPADPGPSTPDLGPPQDTLPVWDKGVKPDPGKPPADECPIAGQYNGCPVVDVCRVDEKSGTLQCSSSTLLKPLYEGCTVHTDCNLPYGCHFGVCVMYCELQFPGSCGFGNCTAVGHPKFGACKPQ